MSLSSQPVSNNENVCVAAYIVPEPPPPPPPLPRLSSNTWKGVGTYSVFSPRLPGVSSGCRRLNLCGPRWPEEARLDRLVSASLSVGLVPDLDFLVAGHRS